MTIAATLAALALACAQGLDATAPLQALLDTGEQTITLPPGRACRLGTAILRRPGQTLESYGVVWLARSDAPLLVVEGEGARVRGGRWIGAGPAAPGLTWERGAIEVRAAAVTLEEIQLVDAPASGVLALDASTVEISRVDVIRPRGAGITLYRSPWGVIQDSAIRAGQFDGIAIGPGSHAAAVLRVHVDHRETVEWARIPWAQYCGYAGGIGAWAARSVSIMWSIVDGPTKPRPGCHLYIPISLAAGSDDSAARQNVVNGGSGGANYCLEISAASGASYDTNWVQSCQTGMLVAAGHEAAGERGPADGATLKTNAVRDAEVGLRIAGPVRGLREHGTHMERVTTGEVRE
jgi:hypothetical protein